jgi:hypothetical protein
VGLKIESRFVLHGAGGTGARPRDGDVA